MNIRGFKITLLFLIVCSLFVVRLVAAQNLIMQRANNIGHWKAYLGNNGLLFYENMLGRSSFWTDPDGHSDSMIFAAGLWLGGYRSSGDTLAPVISWSYDPSSAFTEFVPGSILYDGNQVDSSQSAREKYRVYRSDDLVGSAWPVRVVNGGPAYIDNPLERISSGPSSVLGDEDMFVVYKDTDPAYYNSHRSPIGVEARTTLSFWSHGDAADYIVVRNQLIYQGRDTLYRPALGVALDGDVLNPFDDRATTLEDEAIASSIFYTDSSTTEPLLGIEMLSGMFGPHRTPSNISGVRYWNIGDDPINDASKFKLLYEPKREQKAGSSQDWRVLFSSTSNERLVSGDTINIDFAIFALPATGRIALAKEDSLHALGVARDIWSRYHSNTLGSFRSSVAAPSAMQSFSLYPNPAHDWISVSNFSQNKDGLTLMDIFGRELQKTFTGRFDLHGLAPGVYEIRGRDESRRFVRY